MGRVTAHMGARPDFLSDGRYAPGGVKTSAKSLCITGRFLSFSRPRNLRICRSLMQPLRSPSEAPCEGLFCGCRNARAAAGARPPTDAAPAYWRTILKCDWCKFLCCGSNLRQYAQPIDMQSFHAIEFACYAKIDFNGYF